MNSSSKNLVLVPLLIAMFLQWLQKTLLSKYFQDNQYTQHNFIFHISFQLHQSDRISLVLRPYYTLFYEDLNFAPLISEMDISPIKSTVGDVPCTFGLTVIFYNGPQDR